MTFLHHLRPTATGCCRCLSYIVLHQDNGNNNSTGRGRGQGQGCVYFNVSFILADANEDEMAANPNLKNLTVITDLTTLDQHNLSERLDLTVPAKLAGQWKSFVALDKSPFFIQTPTITISDVSVEKGTLTFDISQQNAFISALENIQSRIKDVIFTRSTLFFKNKVFSMGKIEGAFQGYKENSLVCSVDPKVMIRDEFDDAQTLEFLKEGMECLAVVHVKNMFYTKETIEIVYTVSQIKAYPQEIVLPDYMLGDKRVTEDNVNKECPCPTLGSSACLCEPDTCVCEAGACTCPVKSQATETNDTKKQECVKTVDNVKRNDDKSDFI